MTILSNYPSEYMSYMPLALFVMNYRIVSKKTDSVSHYMFIYLTYSSVCSQPPLS